jgi:hypothetical protein
MAALCRCALTLNPSVQVVCKLVHLSPASLDQRKDGVVEAAKLKADFVACIGVCIPESRVASYEQLGLWCVPEDLFDSFGQITGELLSVDFYLYGIDCFITIVCTVIGGQPREWPAASTPGQVVEPVNTLSL